MRNGTTQIDGVRAGHAGTHRSCCGLFSVSQRIGLDGAGKVPSIKAPVNEARLLFGRGSLLITWSGVRVDRLMLLRQPRGICPAVGGWSYGTRKIKKAVSPHTHKTVMLPHVFNGLHQDEGWVSTHSPVLGRKDRRTPEACCLGSLTSQLQFKKKKKDR